MSKNILKKAVALVALLTVFACYDTRASELLTWVKGKLGPESMPRTSIGQDVPGFGTASERRLSRDQPSAAKPTKSFETKTVRSSGVVREEASQQALLSQLSQGSSEPATPAPEPAVLAPESEIKPLSDFAGIDEIQSRLKELKNKKDAGRVGELFLKNFNNELGSFNINLFNNVNMIKPAWDEFVDGLMAAVQQDRDLPALPDFEARV